MGRSGRSATTGRTRHSPRPVARPLFERTLPSHPEAERAVRAQLERALSQPVGYHAWPQGDLFEAMTSDFFGRHLALHHSLSEQPLTATAFEALFVQTMRAAGRSCSRPPADNFRGHDVLLDGQRLSLKTISGRGDGSGRLTITKLMEAAWIKQIRSRSDALAAVERVQEHLALYERILVLQVSDHLAEMRAAAADDPSFTSIVAELEQTAAAIHCYRLRELPKTMFTPLSSLTAADFSSRSVRSGSTTVHLRRDGRTLLRLSFDGSDQKVTLRGLRPRDCRDHATWIVATPRL